MPDVPAVLSLSTMSSSGPATRAAGAGLEESDTTALAVFAEVLHERFRAAVAPAGEFAAAAAEPFIARVLPQPESQGAQGAQDPGQPLAAILAALFPNWGTPASAASGAAEQAAPLSESATGAEFADGHAVTGFVLSRPAQAAPGNTAKAAVTGLPRPAAETPQPASAAPAPPADFAAARAAVAAENAVPPAAEPAGFSVVPETTLAAVDHDPGQSQPILPAAHTAPAAREATMLRVETPVTAAGWDQEMGNKLVLLVNRGEQRAELTLTPPSMGKIDVTLTMSNEQATAHFASANPVAREALEAALPRLREMLSDAGIQLGHANVSAESSHGGADRDPRRDGGNAFAKDAAVREELTAQHWRRRDDGLIDTFA